MTFQKIVYVAHDNLHQDFGALRTANKAKDVIVLVESKRMTTGRPWHPERLFFMLSAARHFARNLELQGFTVRYIKAQTTIDGLEQAKTEFGDLPVVAAQASSHRQLATLTDYGVTWIENDFFLTPRLLFAEWASQQKSLLLESFYRAQRKRLNILMDGDLPVGGKWNFDQDNRLPPPKNYVWPDYLEHYRDAIDNEVSLELNYSPTDTWATTREGALRQLDFFVENHLAGFGPYEDAVTSENWALHHSLLSPYLNVGLLHASEVITKILSAAKQKSSPIESVEAVVRQIIGWREYINGLYWYLGEEYAQNNHLNAINPLPPLFHDSSKTEMACVKSTISDIEKRAWTHHIPRLMILSNLALTSGTSPQEYLAWMREQFVDASDWVMVPNVIGMATYADGGKFTTKPYAAGGAYLNRMTNHCKGCKFDPKLRTGDTACPFTTLYWDFIDRNREEFSKNQRMSQALMGLNRLNNLDEVKVRAKEVLQLLSNGKL